MIVLRQLKNSTTNAVVPLKGDIVLAAVSNSAVCLDRFVRAWLAFD